MHLLPWKVRPLVGLWCALLAWTCVGLCGCAAEKHAPDLSLTGSAGGQPVPEYGGFNVILVSLDTLRAANVHSLGYPRQITPAIDAVAREGFSFANQVSVAPWTLPATMSWFTGVYPSEHGLTNPFAVYAPPSSKLANLKEQSPRLVPLAQVLRENGYATAGFTGNAEVAGEFGFALGFNTYYSEKRGFGGMEEAIPRALEWMRKNRDAKFFLFLQGYDLYGQYSPAGGLDYRFVDKDYDRRFDGSAEEQERLREDGLVKGDLGLREADVRFWRAIYDERVQRADELFARFMSGVAELGLMEKTILVLTSDHGTELGEHGRIEQGFTLYDELLRTPLIIRLPDRRAGRIIDDQVSSIDVMPTVLDLVGVSMPDRAATQLRGASLVPALRGGPVARDVFAETDYRQYTHKRSVSTVDGWKFIYTLEDGTRELYNLRKDPEEKKNVAGRQEKKADELQQKLFSHFASLGCDLGGRKWEVGLYPAYEFRPRETKSEGP